MSGAKKISTVPDASGKLSEDKIDLYESSTIDSGFLSGEILSGELTEDEGLTSGTISKGSIKEDEERSCDSPVMRLDSGIVDVLSEDLSSLSLKQNINNLNAPKKAEFVPNVVVPELPQRQATDLFPWMKFYEQDEDGDTSLHIMIAKGLPQYALALIRLAPTPRLLDTLNDSAQSPLHLAVCAGQAQVVRWLVVGGARPDPRDAIGDSPLHMAARKGDLSCCRALLEPVTREESMALGIPYQVHGHRRCDVNQWNYQGQTSVHVAAIYGEIDVLRYLVSYGADINAREGQGGYTALHFAVLSRNERLAQFLLMECEGLDPTILTYGGRSVLDFGKNVSSALIEILVAKGVPSPYPSDDEIESSDDEYELPIISSQIRVA